MDLKKIINILWCIECEGDLKINDNELICSQCNKEYPVVEGVPRFVEKKFYQLTDSSESIVEKTKNYFGYEWDVNKDWGFIEEKKLKKEERIEWHGGTVEARKKAFESKCRLSVDELNDAEIILDAGCGNGRYTYETAIRTNKIVIGIDIAYGSVKSAFFNTQKLNNVLILQANLFNLPFKDNVIDACFSNGVLMHTGNARKAFDEVSRTVKKDGIFVAHLYHRLNPLWELNDFLIRKYTTKLSIEKGVKFAQKMKKIAIKVSKIPGLLRFFNLFIRLQPTEIHMYDWYSAPTASHHTYYQVKKWYKKNGFRIIDSRESRFYPFVLPWALNIKGKKINCTIDK